MTLKNVQITIIFKKIIVTFTNVLATAAMKNNFLKQKQLKGWKTMRLLISCMIGMVLTLQCALANCDIKKIEEKQDGTFSYPVECHVDYGKLRYNEESRKKQVEHLKETIKLKDLAIDYSNKRIENWQQATYNLEDRILKIEKTNEKIKWIYFGIGIAVMGGAVWGASQLVK